MASNEPLVQELSRGAETLAGCESHWAGARSSVETYIKANTTMLIIDFEADQKNKNSNVSFNRP